MPSKFNIEALASLSVKLQFDSLDTDDKGFTTDAI